MKYFRHGFSGFGRAGGVLQREHRDPKQIMLAGFASPGAIASSVMPDMEPPGYAPGALGNLSYGVCMLAALANRINRSRIQRGRKDLVNEADVMLEYENFGYVPGNPSTDNGMYALTAMKRLQQVGMFPRVPAKCKAYVEVEARKQGEVAFAVSALNGVIWCFGLPIGSFDQQVWDIPEGGWQDGKGPWSLGGHAIDGAKASPGRNHGRTWGYIQGWTIPWQVECCPEAYAMILEEEDEDEGRSIAGLDKSGLYQAVEVVRMG